MFLGRRCLRFPKICKSSCTCQQHCCEQCPPLQGLLDKPQALYALVLSPTRELAIQIAEQFEALGSDIGVKCAVLVGGIDMMAQAIALGKRPHIIVGTPGRVVDHLSNTKVRLSTQNLTCQASATCVREGARRSKATRCALSKLERGMHGMHGL